ncbi:transposase [Streptomyces chilikensis]|uniref:IS701 family transposase n=1 Tax=Streptomyces chilikensis TaxID=1194079 RepID=UPI000B302172|nr:transposase [Streptomyces chilikensis]
MDVLHKLGPREQTELHGNWEPHAFAEEVFGRLPRADQRRWAELYVRALLVTPGKKSVRRLAESVSGSPTASQSMHQFVSASPWDWHATRQDLLRLIERTTTATAWTLTPAYIPKRGEHSAGVHRRFDPQLGKVVTCQLGIALLRSDGRTALPIDWNLYIPQDWTAGTDRGARARVPDGIGGALWSQTADLLDRVATWTTGPQVPVTADLSWMPDRSTFLAHLVRNEHPFVVEVPETLGVRSAAAQPVVSGTVSAGRLLAAQRGTTTGGEQHHGLDLRSLPVSLPEATAGRTRLRMLAQRLANGRRRIWITSLVDQPLPQLLPLMGQPRLGAAVMNTLSGDFGLQDFEGRLFPGWHHHTTLVSAAFAQYCLYGSGSGRRA